MDSMGPNPFTEERRRNVLEMELVASFDDIKTLSIDRPYAILRAPGEVTIQETSAAI